MRRALLVTVGALGVCAAFAISACSSDDSTGTTTDAGGTDSAADTSVKVDSGPKDSGGGTDSGPCQTCSNFLLIGPQGTACTTGSPSSADLIHQFFDECMCDVDGGGCYVTCGTTCTEFTNPDDNCVNCFSATCSAQLAACAADGADGGTTSDGGDGGDGG